VPRLSPRRTAGILRNLSYGSRTTGAVFRPIAKGESLYAAWPTDRRVAEIIKTHAARVGLAPGPGGDSAASASTMAPPLGPESPGNGPAGAPTLGVVAAICTSFFDGAKQSPILVREF
jgi:hypothetical protein